MRSGCICVWLGLKLVHFNQLKTQTQHSEPFPNPVYQYHDTCETHAF